MAKRSIYNGPCPIERVLHVFAGKWKPTILFHLSQQETVRFNELRRLIPDVSQRVLTMQLRELESDGLIHRKHTPEIPPKVEYSATDLARSLDTVLLSIRDWGIKNMEQVEEARVRFEK